MAIYLCITAFVTDIAAAAYMYLALQFYAGKYFRIPTTYNLYECFLVSKIQCMNITAAGYDRL